MKIFKWLLSNLVLVVAICVSLSTIARRDAELRQLRVVNQDLLKFNRELVAADAELKMADAELKRADARLNAACDAIEKSCRHRPAPGMICIADK
jgi:septal ring factor EnvC (AmiA/AmiB activator)